MTWDREDLKHAVQQARAVNFVLRQPPRQEQVLEVLDRLQRRAGRCDTAATPTDHWRALQVRLTGSAPWGSLVSRYIGPSKTAEDGRKARASFHSTENILVHRSYCAYSIEGIQYVLDAFNPANELHMPYLGAGEPVLALITQELSFGEVQKRLAGNRAFFEIVKELSDVLEPEHVAGTYSMASVLFGYDEGRVDPQIRPWEFLYPLTLLKKPKELPASRPGKVHTTNDSLALLWEILVSEKLAVTPLARFFKRIEVWDQDRVLALIGDGLTSVVDKVYVEAARALGMTAVQEIADGAVVKRAGGAASAPS